MSQPPAPFYGVLYTSANLYTCSILGFGAFPSVALFQGYSTEASHSSSSLHLLQVIYFLLFFSHAQPPEDCCSRDGKYCNTVPAADCIIQQGYSCISHANERLQMQPTHR